MRTDSDILKDVEFDADRIGVEVQGHKVIIDVENHLTVDPTVFSAV